MGRMGCHSSIAGSKRKPWKTWSFFPPEKYSSTFSILSWSRKNLRLRRVNLFLVELISDMIRMRIYRSRIFEQINSLISSYFDMISWRRLRLRKKFSNRKRSKQSQHKYLHQNATSWSTILYYELRAILTKI